MTIPRSKASGIKIKPPKRRKGCYIDDINEALQVHQPIPWVNEALQFTRSLPSSVQIERPGLCAFSDRLRVASHVFPFLTRLPICFVYGVNIVYSEDALHFNLTRRLGDTNHCVFRLWDLGISE